MCCGKGLDIKHALAWTGDARWNGARCPELVAGLGKHVVVVVMSTDVHGNLSTMGHVTRRAAHPITPRNPDIPD